MKRKYEMMVVYNALQTVVLPKERILRLVARPYANVPSAPFARVNSVHKIGAFK